MTIKEFAKTDLTFGVPVVALIVIAMVAVFMVLNRTAPFLLQEAFAVLVALAPLWAPFFLLRIFWKLWVRYRRANFHDSQKIALLEVRIPREMRKSPLAMEAALAGLHIGIGETTFVDRNFKGKTRTWFSLELVSIDGNIHFYIWTRDFFKELVKAQIYAQYPEVEIAEVDDYTKYLPFDLSKYRYWGSDFKLTKPDAYPLRTYIDYGLDSTAAKEEEKTDPFASVLELLGSIPKGHQIWIQILIQTHKGTRKWPWSSRFTWREEAEKLIERMLKKASERTGRVVDVDEESAFGRLPALTEGERETIKAIDRSLGKPGFDCGIRVAYFAEKDKFHAIYLVGLLGVWKQFSSFNLNSLTYTRWLGEFDFSWQDFREIRQNRMRRRFYEAFRLRSWFHEPYKTPTYVLNTEELATIYHFPGEVAKTPTIPRVPSRRGEPPANLPI